MMFDAGGEIFAGDSDTPGTDDVTASLPQKKNVEPRMNSPRSIKNGSLPCITVTFASGEQRSTPQQNIAVEEIRQGVGLTPSPERQEKDSPSDR